MSLSNVLSIHHANALVLSKCGNCVIYTPVFVVDENHAALVKAEIDDKVARLRCVSDGLGLDG